MKKIGMLAQIFIGFILAIVLGAIFGPKMEIVQPVGDLFLRLIKFIVVPLVLASLITGITSLNNIQKLLTVGGKTLAYFMVTTFFAVSIGLVVATIIAPGKGLDISMPTEASEQQEMPSTIDTFLNIIPTNPFESLSTGNILQIIFIAIAIGIAITAVGEKAKPLANLFEALAEVMYKITGYIMKLAPIGIFGILAPIIGNYGLAIILPLLKVILAVAIACFIHLLIIYSVAVRTLGKMSPIKFIKGILPAGLVAFTTASSSALCQFQLKIRKKILGFQRKLALSYYR